MTFAGSGDGQSGSARAHFVLVPMMAQGHTIPMTDMARLLAEHGAQVSFITTPVNAARLEGFAADVKAAGLAVQLVELHFPAAEFGLPDGCENIDMIQSKNLFSNFMEACGALQEPLMAYLREQQRSPPSCIISDMMHWWTGDIARELGIPRLTFRACSEQREKKLQELVKAKDCYGKTMRIENGGQNLKMVFGSVERRPQEAGT